MSRSPPSSPRPKPCGYASISCVKPGTGRLPGTGRRPASGSPGTDWYRPKLDSEHPGRVPSCCSYPGPVVDASLLNWGRDLTTEQVAERTVRVYRDRSASLVELLDDSARSAYRPYLAAGDVRLSSVAARHATGSGS